MNQGIIYLMIMMFCAASYNTAQKLASQHISPPLAALISTIVVGILAGMITLGYKATGQELIISKKGILFAILIGIFATGIEYFGVLGFSKGVPLTVASAVTGIISILMIILYGKFLFQEGVTLQRVAALILAALASFLAATG